MSTRFALSDVPNRPLRLSDRLDREWVRLNRRPAVLACVRSWHLTERPFASLDELLALAGYRTDAGADGDQLLGRLVAVAAADPLACRIVLQRLLPGLLAIVREEQERNPSIDAFDLVVGEAWIAITRYRIESRPTHVAARLLHDARHRAFTSHRRHRVVQEEATPHAGMLDVIDESQWSAFDELVAVLSEARRRGLDDWSVATIRDFLRHGSSANVAAARAMNPRSIRYRHRRAITRVRRLVAA